MPVSLATTRATISAAVSACAARPNTFTRQRGAVVVRLLMAAADSNSLLLLKSAGDIANSANLLLAFSMLTREGATASVMSHSKRRFECGAARQATGQGHHVLFGLTFHLNLDDGTHVGNGITQQLKVVVADCDERQRELLDVAESGHASGQCFRNVVVKHTFLNSRKRRNEKKKHHKADKKARVDCLTTTEQRHTSAQ
eukprot:m.293935 g.293935  ORF g.293935 m.293935 type:complete len:199 (-) comp22962_c0_seq7:1071-1667(-)